MTFMWPQSAQAELRAIDRETALRILHAPTGYAAAGAGDVKALAVDWQGYFRLRVVDYRVTSKEIAIIRIRHRSDVFR